MTESNNQPKQVMAEGRFIRAIKVGRWEYVERVRTSGGVMVAAVTPEHKLLIIEQYRVPTGCNVLELPAGLAGDIEGEEDEAHARAAHRELLEETGYEAEALEYLTEGPTTPGLANETVTMFLARNVRKVHEGGGHEGEEIRLHEVPLDEVETWLARKMEQGVAVEPRIYAGLYFALTRLGRFPGS